MRRRRRRRTSRFVSRGEEIPGFEAFALGTLEYPDRSTTLVIPVDEPRRGSAVGRLTGPGIAGEARLHAGPLPAASSAGLAENPALFPRGVDIVFVCGDRIAALPRTTVVEA